MTRLRRASIAAIVAALSFTGAAAAADGLSVKVDRTSISTKLGHKFGFRSTITNRSSTAASGLIAHLNVLSLRNGVYVDPEDWSTHRTRYLAPIPAGRSKTITWTLEAVNAGTIGVYVAVLPENGAGRPATGQAIRVAIAQRKTLNSGGILPLALGVPGLLGLVAVGLRLRRKAG